MGPWGCGRRRLGHAFLLGPRHAAYYINSGISSPCGEKGGAQAGERKSKGILGDAGNWEVPWGGFRPSGKARCWDPPWSGWLWPLAASWIHPWLRGWERKRQEGGKKGKRKNLHVENTRPYGWDLKQQESAKAGSRDGGVGGVGVPTPAFEVLPQFPRVEDGGKAAGMLFPSPISSPKYPPTDAGLGSWSCKKAGVGGF